MNGKGLKKWIEDHQAVFEVGSIVANLIFAAVVAYFANSVAPARQPIGLEVDLHLEEMGRQGSYAAVGAKLVVKNTGPRTLHLLSSVLTVSAVAIELGDQGQEAHEKQADHVLSGSVNGMATRWISYGNHELLLVRVVYKNINIEPGEVLSKDFIFAAPVDSGKILHGQVVLPALAEPKGMSVQWDLCRNAEVSPTYYYTEDLAAPEKKKIINPRAPNDEEFLQGRKFRAFNASVEIPLWPAIPEPAAPVAQPSATGPAS